MTFHPLVHDGQGRFGIEVPDPPEPEMRTEVVVAPDAETGSANADRIAELRQALRRAASRWPVMVPVGTPPGEAHGHVRPREDGTLMRCGGPNRCGACERELRALERGDLPTEFDEVLR